MTVGEWAALDPVDQAQLFYLNVRRYVANKGWKQGAAFMMFMERFAPGVERNSQSWRETCPPFEWNDLDMPDDVDPLVMDWIKKRNAEWYKSKKASELNSSKWIKGNGNGHAAPAQSDDSINDEIPF
jgi:hypothetical protein